MCSPNSEYIYRENDNKTDDIDITNMCSPSVNFKAQTFKQQQYDVITTRPKTARPERDHRAANQCSVR